MKIEVIPNDCGFEMRAYGSTEPFALGINMDLPVAKEVQRRVNNYGALVAALRAVMRNPTIAGVIAADTLTATQEG